MLSRVPICRFSRLILSIFATMFGSFVVSKSTGLLENTPLSSGFLITQASLLLLWLVMLCNMYRLAFADIRRPGPHS